MSAPTCSGLSAAAREELAGTASQAEHLLLVEVRGAWGREALESLGPDLVRERLRSWQEEGPRRRVLLLRRPERRDEPEVAAFTTRVTESGGELRRLDVRFHGDLLDADLDGGTSVDGTLLLVCTHGRRDPCCARLGIPLHEALAPHVPADALWQSSHQGGHRFAGNVLAVPSGVQLGRVLPSHAPAVAAELLAGRIPLDHYRGRTLHPPALQAAEVAVRRALGLTGVADVRPTEAVAGRVRVWTSRGEATVVVAQEAGPLVPASCGAEPESAPAWRARVESLP